MIDTKLELDMEELESAEDFFEYFGLEYKQAVIRVNRLHILQRFHDYLSVGSLPVDEKQRREFYKELLRNAYDDFVNSDSLTEKVFNVFKIRNESKFVPLSSIQIEN